MVSFGLNRLILSVMLLTGVALFAGQARAVPTNIIINNFSFESPVATTGTPATAVGCPTGWTCTNFTNGGVYAPTSTQYVSGSDGLTSPNRIVPDGNQAAFMVTGQANQSLTQDTMAIFEAGKKYTLTAYAGFRNDDPNSNWGTATLQLLAAGGGLAGTGPNAPVLTISTPARGQWVIETLTYIAQAGDAGKHIGVGLLGSTNGNRVQINWDDVVLVPEPSTLLLLGLGFGSFAFTRRKRKNPV